MSYNDHIFTIFLLVTVSCISSVENFKSTRQKPRGLSRRYIQTSQDYNDHPDRHLGEAEKKALGNVFGQQEVIKNEDTFEDVAEMGQHDHGAIEHKLSSVYVPSDEQMEGIVDDARLNAVNDNSDWEGGRETEDQNAHGTQLDSEVVKNALKELLHKLELSEHDERPKSHGHCNLHGLWLSAVAGAAIELLPQSDGVINTKIFDIPQPPQGNLLDSHWTGRGMVSAESPTTITIVFQEHINHKMHDVAMMLPPRTAVFVGQCLVCDGSPLLQGTWVVFPNSQQCFPTPDENKGGTTDIMYQIRY